MKTNAGLPMRGGRLVGMHSAFPELPCRPPFPVEHRQETDEVGIGKIVKTYVAYLARREPLQGL